MRLPGLTVALALVLALIAAAGAGAAARPDPHDRALARQLDRKIATFGLIVSSTGENAAIKRELANCPAFQTKDAGKAFAAVFALVPALITRMVDDYKPQLTDLTNTVTAMHPDAPLFRQWIAALGRSYTLMLQFDNHGQKVDLCEATTVLLDKHSTAADFQRVLGVDPRLLAKLFRATDSNTVSRLNPRMRTFFVAAGLPAKHAKTLTST